MHPLARRRCLAYFTDAACYLGIAAAMLPAGVLVAVRTDLGTRPAYGHLISTVPPLIATLVAARAESGPHRATRGKRRQDLVVAGPDGGALTPGAALARNAVKILVPWQLGHMTAVSAAWGGFQKGDPLAYGSSIAVYTVIGVYAWTGLRGSGRGLHDLLFGSSVRLVAATE